MTDVLTLYLRAFGVEKIWEPAAGDGQKVTALRKRGFAVIGTDVRDGSDFFECDQPSPYDGIATNPPYGSAQEFIEPSLELTKPIGGVVALLLKVDYDPSITRRHLFADCPAFALKLVLTKRIVWFEPKVASLSEIMRGSCGRGGTLARRRSLGHHWRSQWQRDHRLPYDELAPFPSAFRCTQPFRCRPY